MPIPIAKFISGFPPLPEGRKYLVVQQFYWGAGPTLPEAWANMRKEGGSNDPKEFLLYNAPAKAKVDGMGMLTYNMDDGEPILLFRRTA